LRLNVWIAFLERDRAVGNELSEQNSLAPIFGDWATPVRFPEAIPVEVESVQYKLKGLLYQGTLSHAKKLRIFVNWTGDAFFEWENQRLSIPAKRSVFGFPASAEPCFLRKSIMRTCLTVSGLTFGSEFCLLRVDRSGCDVSGTAAGAVGQAGRSDQAFRGVGGH
jgi:hypothetical protein